MVGIKRVSLLVALAVPVAVNAFTVPVKFGVPARGSAVCSGPSLSACRTARVVLRSSTSDAAEQATNTPEQDAAYPLPDNVRREDFLALRAEGMAPTDAVACLEKGMTVKQAILELDKAFARRIATGDGAGFFKSYVDVQGDYVDDGWVDETPSSGGGFGGFLGGLFGQGSAAEAPVAAAAAVEGKAAPAQADGATQWVTFTDEASGDNYYHNPATGITTWDKPAELV